MTMNDKEVRSLPGRHEGSLERSREASPTVVMDVRATVEYEFLQMEQLHNRIRAEELAARLAQQMID